jgi:hypothetical protein
MRFTFSQKFGICVLNFSILLSCGLVDTDLYVEEKASFQCLLLGNAAESLNEWEGKNVELNSALSTRTITVHRSLRAVVF